MPSAAPHSMTPLAAALASGEVSVAGTRRALSSRSDWWRL